MTPIAPLITAFLRERLPVERCASQHTCCSYAYSFQLLFQHVSTRLGIAPSEIKLEQLDAQTVMSFLQHLQSDRGNSPRTRNARLAAIKSFFRFVEHRVPAALDQVRRVLAIPSQRSDTKLVRHLSAAEQKALLDAPDPQTATGVRDRAICHLAIAGGLRVSELTGLRIGDLTFRDRYVDLRVRGKGRKERVLPLWKEVGDSLRAWLALRADAPAPEVFLNARNEPIGRSGVAYILKKHQAVAAATCPSIAAKPLTPHVLRHSCGMNVLRSTGDIRKVALWLGHEHTDTTEIYVRGDATEKLAMLGEVVPPTLRPGKFSPPDKLIASLKKG